MAVMEIRFRFSDGKFVDAEDPEEFVEKMNASSYASRESVTEFMEDVAERGRKLGIFLNVESPQKFLESLIANNVVAVLSVGAERN